jgi:hypothetical protein
MAEYPAYLKKRLCIYISSLSVVPCSCSHEISILGTKSAIYFVGLMGTRGKQLASLLRPINDEHLEGKL